jgi:hypothetical protein
MLVVENEKKAKDVIEFRERQNIEKANAEEIAKLKLQQEEQKRLLREKKEKQLGTSQVCRIID